MVCLDNDEALTAISKRLQPGERLIWHSVPSPWRAAVPYLYSLAFMTFWTGAALYGASKALERVPDPGLDSLLGALGVPALFVLIGAAAWLWVAKKITDGWRTAYGLTNRRVIIAVGRNGAAKSYSAAALSGMKRTGDEFRGSILFESGLRGWGYGYDHAGLYGIENPARVEALIYETLLPTEKGAAI
jgi:hypothetical protein